MNLIKQLEFLKIYEFYHIQDDIETFDMSMVELTYQVFEIYQQYKQLFQECKCFTPDVNIDDYFFEQHITNNTKIGEGFELANKAIKSIGKCAFKCFVANIDDYFKEYEQL